MKKIWRLVRTVEESFEVECDNKDEVSSIADEPYFIRVLSEKITLIPHPTHAEGEEGK